jgi:hypothetical protein
LEFEIFAAGKAIPRTVNVKFVLNSGRKFSLSGKIANSVKLELIIKKYLVPNLEI